MPQGQTKIQMGRNFGGEKVSLKAKLKLEKRFPRQTILERHRSTDVSWCMDVTRYEDGDLREEEVINFARFFVSELRSVNIPWSLNVLDRYYDTKENTW